MIGALLIIFSSIYVFNNTEKDKKYNYEKLSALSSEELYKVFLENGLKVDEELKTYMSDDEIANIVLKGQFDLMIRGNTSCSHHMYKRFAQEVKRVYELIVDN